MKPGEKLGFLRGRFASFACAARGISLLVKRETNARIHLLATALVAAAGALFRVTRGEWCLLALAMGLVWVAEGANAAIEHLADRVSREHDQAIRDAKDLAAGAVLLGAIAAAVIGFIVLGPHVCTLLTGR
jgi:diacylglycerol kinase (ATP)